MSRGGEKLAGALDAFGLDVDGPRGARRRRVDGRLHRLPASAAARARVIAVDVGYGQLAWSAPPGPARRRCSSGRTRARSTRRCCPRRRDLATIDVSFISLALVLPAVAAVLAPAAESSRS